MNFRRGRAREEPEVNLIPLIDVLIVVLIFLFLTTTYNRFAELQIKSKGALREVDASGDWGYFWSTYSLRSTPKAGGNPTTTKGKSVFIVKRQRDGSWKIARLIDNSDE